LAVGSFSQNDQGASASILSFARKGDLVLPDLGYALLEIFEQLAQKGVSFLSRWQFYGNSC
jgi:hypothetical protein